MKKRIAASVLALALVAFPLSAILGISFGGGGDIVHDPINYGELALMLTELIKTYEQLKEQYEFWLRMAKTVPVDMSTRYLTPGVPWYGLRSEEHTSELQS